MSKLRVIAVIPSAENAGTELSVLKAGILFSKYGIENQIWTLSKSTKFDEICKQNDILLKKFPLHRTKPIRTIQSFVAIIKMTFKYRKGYVFHFFLPKTYLVGFFLGKVLRMDYILGVRGKINYRGPFVEQMLKYAFKDAKLIICNAQHLVSEIGLRFKLTNKSILCVSNMVEQTTTNQLREVHKFNDVTAVVLANLIDYKGHLFLLECLSKMNQLPRIILMGEGPLEATIRKRIDELGLTAKVTILRNPDVNLTLSKSHFAIHPSETEGLSNAILEEISYGLPVIAFNVGGNGEIISHNFNGYLLELGDALSLSKAIETLTLDSKTRERFGKNAFATSKLFSPENYLQQTSNIYLDFMRDVKPKKYFVNLCRTRHANR